MACPPLFSRLFFFSSVFWLCCCLQDFGQVGVCGVCMQSHLVLELYHKPQDDERSRGAPMTDPCMNGKTRPNAGRNRTAMDYRRQEHV